MSAELEDCDLIVDLHASARTRVLAFRQRAAGAACRRRSACCASAGCGRAGPARGRADPRDGALRGGARAARDRGRRARRASRRAPRPSAGRTSFLADWRPAGAPVALCPGARARHQALARGALVRARSRARGGGRAAGRLLDRGRTPCAAGARGADRGRRRPRAGASSRCRAWRRCCRAACAAVTHDSGLMHLAAARGAQVVAIFGSTSPVLGFAPAGEGHAGAVPERALPALHAARLAACPRGHFRCMTGIGVEEVLAALARARRRPLVARGARGLDSAPSRTPSGPGPRALRIFRRDA